MSNSVAFELLKWPFIFFYISINYFKCNKEINVLSYPIICNSFDHYLKQKKRKISKTALSPATAAGATHRYQKWISGRILPQIDRSTIFLGLERRKLELKMLTFLFLTKSSRSQKKQNEKLLTEKKNIKFQIGASFETNRDRGYDMKSKVVQNC